MTGFLNSATNTYSLVGGGYSNSATGVYSTVLGGQLNTASALYSNILGGCGNNASSACSFIAGMGITTDRTNTLFVNNLSIKSIPTSSVGLPSGAVYSNAGILTIVP